ncbi:MAG: GGDEF domain-containing protein [Xanthomonadaceae bacterium]|nr:GGDEF domain-containing protein [Xanthomonadaceae bacterium]
MSKRLADFIRSELEPILEEWERFAGTLFHAEHMGGIDLRDHAGEMLLDIADDLDTDQSDSEQSAKSKGDGPEDQDESSAEVHGGDRHGSGFSVMETVSEFRALRASVVSLWTKACPMDSDEHREDLTRFHEAIDQAVSESLQQYSMLNEMETRLFGAILVASPDPIYVLDLEGKLRYANQATTDLFALDLEAIIGKTLSELEFPFAEEIQRNLGTVSAEQSTWRGKFVHQFASGPGDRFDYLLAPVLDEQQNTEAIVCIFQDVTERTLAEEKVWHSAHHDELTGLPNRRLFLDRLEQEIKHSRRSCEFLSVVFLDLDGFKEVNDSLGHEAGDFLLIDVAQRLIDCVREEDTVARLGGDEFALLLTGTKLRGDVELVAQAVKDTLAFPFEVAKRSVNISASVGVSLFPEDASSPGDLLRAADQAMYKEKNQSSKGFSGATNGHGSGKPLV